MVQSDFRQLDAFIKGVSSSLVIKIGIFGDSSSRKTPGLFSARLKRRRTTKTPSALTNAEVGAIAEFGRMVGKPQIPKRSWLRMPLLHESQAILDEAGPLAMQWYAKGNPKKALQVVAIAAENAIQRAFDTAGWGSWSPNSARTQAKKGSASPLIDTGQLRKAVTSRVGVPE